MRGGGLEGVSSATYLFWKMIFFKNHFESLTVKTCLALSLGFILCIYSSWDDFEHGLIVGSQRPELLMNVNFEPIIRGLKSDIFEV